MARDDSDTEEASSWSEEEAGKDDEESCEEEAELSDGSGDTKSAGRGTNERAAGKSSALVGKPPKPPGQAPRLGPGRPSLGASLPVRPARPAVSRLRDEGDDEVVEQPSEADLQRRREENIRALVNNSLQTCRQPLMSKFLTVLEGEMTLRKPFQSPVQGAPRMSDALRRKLVARRHFVPWGSSTPLPIPTMSVKPQTPLAPAAPEPPPEPAPEPAQPPAEPLLPEGIEPLVLWQAPPGPGGLDGCGPEGPPGGEVVEVDPMLVRFLRPHQREGVQFMFDCVTGQRLEGRQGCILADDMGLGKTLQGITLMWTLLTGGHPLLGGLPIARRAIIVCPTSLVSNWDNECTKWLKGRLKTLAMCESSREDVVANIGMFLHPSNVYKVLIISYETFRMHAERFQVPHACDLLLCDEAHRLKNDATLTNRALGNLPCKRRVLLSGTPMQNHLDEFFAMVDFCNPGVLGPPAQFRKYYELPILAGREPDAHPEEVALGEERSRELSGLTNNFILRRTNKLLSQHLPPKVIEVVCCRLTELQRQLYGHFLQSKAARRVLNGRTSGVLSAITSLKKLCNHPKLIYDAVHSKAAAAAAGEDGEGGRAEGFEDVGALFPPGLFDNGRVGRGGMAAGWEAVSGKMAVLARMLHVLYTETTDRIVLVSNYTSSLDLFAQLCRERGYPFVRLDGTTTINKRQKLVKVFNDPAERQFAFLLSSKAGGCGLNLIGANRLVLFDPDWNPANDQQAAARVWRDGQRKRVFVYRFLSTGSIEEKVYQRQLSKEGLKQLVSKNGKAAANVMTAEDLRELFTLNPDSWSDTYDYMCGGPITAPPAGPINLTYSDDEEEDDGVLVAGKAARGGGAAGGAGTAASGSGGGGGGGEAGDGVVFGRVAPVHKKQSGEPAEEDLANWGHHPSPETVPDAVMRRVAAPDVSFIFSCSVAGKPIEGGDEEERRLAETPTAGQGGAAGQGSSGAAGRPGSGTRGGGSRSLGGGLLFGGGSGGGRAGALAATPRLSTPAGAAPTPRLPPPSSQTPRTAAMTPGCNAAVVPSGAGRAVTAATPVTATTTATTTTTTTTTMANRAATSPSGSARAPSPPTTATTIPATAQTTATAITTKTTNAGPRTSTPQPPVPPGQPRQRTAPSSVCTSSGRPANVAAAASTQPLTSSGAALLSSGAAATSAAKLLPPGHAPTATKPLSLVTPGSVGQNSGGAPPPTARSTGNGGGVVSGGSSSSAGCGKPPSSVTGAVASGANPPGSAAGSRGTGVAAVAADPSKASAPSAPLPTQPLKSSAAPNSQQAPRAAAVTTASAAAAATAAAPGATAAVAASSRLAPQPKSTGVTAPAPPPSSSLSRQANAGVPRPAAAAAGPGPAAAAAPKPTATVAGVRSRASMEATGAQVVSEAPKTKRQRAPGWYIDSDDDDFL